MTDNNSGIKVQSVFLVVKYSPDRLSFVEAYPIDAVLDWLGSVPETDFVYVMEGAPVATYVQTSKSEISSEEEEELSTVVTTYVELFLKEQVTSDNWRDFDNI